jgi:putative protein-disulfide isomerase
VAEDQSLKIWLVTDPMCSWCWGMAPAIELASSRLEGEVEFDFMLGGINTHGSQFIGDYGRRHLFKIWHEVEATTGQSFGFRLPEQFIYNSTLSCIAVHAMRRRLGKAPFGYLHRLQQVFFVEGRNVNDGEVLADVAADFGFERRGFEKELEDPDLATHAAEQFASSRTYGTAALPNVLWEWGETRALLAGGYADADMLVELIEAKRNSLAPA